MKHVKAIAVLLALGAGAALFCETCHRIGGAVARAERIQP